MGRCQWFWDASFGHACGVRVQRERFLGLTGLTAGGFLSLTAFQAEGCGIARRAMSFIMPPSAVTSASSIIIILTLVHPFATSWPSSPKGDARTLRDLLFCVIWHENHSADWLAALATPYPSCAIGHAFRERFLGLMGPFGPKGS